MPELAYALNHPAHPDNAGKKFPTPATPFTHDYPANAPARGGQGQPIATQAGSEHPRDGHKHLHGLAGATLVEKQREFARLDKDEQKARWQWNQSGIPAKPEEE
jgi:hypothetical protein